MGSCASVNRSSTDSAMKLRFSFGSRTDKLLIPPSPVKDKDKPVNEETLVNGVQGSFAAYGSKEETFFDSQPWLDSDCESDFQSVNGDFTPSRGNTPVHHNFSVATPSTVNKTLLDGPASVLPSPGEKKKKLLEFFQECGDDQDVDTYASVPNSTCSSEWTANGDALIKEKSMKSTPCCLPGLLSCRSFSERKKMSPTIAVNEKP
ncbi:hypothetical protein HS088_TW12G00773 [Tripterygium wilfordii]|uniref:Uncharacterized protein n=1 Tax=Tripterygium wilfordii TaxID=458696 RepID=A0A7J7CZM1_TRIWF|nr:uncharacterized protein At3g27210-like [Tripterygium wilfordii]KAF5739565.1 hypothetical protein HS088_TW12G00773 [Tripterygium wilfordii]